MADSYVCCRECCKLYKMNTSRHLFSALFIARHLFEYILSFLQNMFRNCVIFYLHILIFFINQVSENKIAFVTFNIAM